MSFKTVDLDKVSDKFFKIAEGQNKIRVISEPVPLWVSFDKETKKAKKYLDEGIAKTDLQAKKRYCMWVIDRADGKVKMAEFGTSVMRQIQILALDDDYGFDSIPPYDLKITRAGGGMETKYTVTPMPKSDLSEADGLLLLNIESVETFLKKQPGLVTEAESIPF